MGKISVLGTGGWGIALAVHAHSLKHSVTMWSPFENEVEELNRERENKKLLKGIKIPDEIRISTDIDACKGSDITIIAVPSFAVRSTAARLKGIDCGIIVNVAKGFEKGSLLRLSEVIAEELPEEKIVVLSGPSHAEEVSRGVPTTVVSASKDIEASDYVQKALISSAFRIYTNHDVVGVEVGGAMKNVMAVAAGIENGLKIGDNTRAALLTRGLAEIARLGVAMGAETHTFMGLSGLGDLIVTCMSEHSRNNRFGNLVGQGIDVDAALKAVGTVEGYYATDIARDLAAKFDVDMPISEECYNILYNGSTPLEAIKSLMSRPRKTEEEQPWMYRF